MQHYHGTTIVSVRRGAQVALGGDGQVTLGHVVVKGGARKVRRIYHDKVLAGFAGGTADAFSLLDRFEGKLEKYQGHLMRAAVELAKDWRTDRMLRRLEAMLIVANVETTLVLTGNGDVLDPEDGICAIGSGGACAQAAARALAHNTELRPREIVDKSLEIAAELCIYTNQNRVIETLDYSIFQRFARHRSRSPYELAAGSPPSLRDGDLLRPHRSPYCLRARLLVQSH